MCFLLNKEWIGERSRTECFHLLVAVATVNSVVVGSVGVDVAVDLLVAVAAVKSVVVGSVDVAVDDVDAAEPAGVDVPAAVAKE